MVHLQLCVFVRSTSREKRRTILLLACSRVISGPDCVRTGVAPVACFVSQEDVREVPENEGKTVFAALCPNCNKSAGWHRPRGAFAPGPSVFRGARGVPCGGFGWAARQHIGVVCSVDACGRLLVVGSLTLGPPQLKPLPPVCSSWPWLWIAFCALGVLCARVCAAALCAHGGFVLCLRGCRVLGWPGASRFIWFDRVRLVLCVLWVLVDPWNPRVLCVRLVSRLEVHARLGLALLGHWAEWGVVGRRRRTNCPLNQIFR